MADYVADTHALLWYFAQPKRLGADAASAFAEFSAGTANLIIPVIVVAEIIFVLESGRIHADFAQVLDALQSIPNVQIVDLTLARTLELYALITIHDMHDRMIVAEAVARDATLTTRDAAITNSGLVQTIW